MGVGVYASVQRENKYKKKPPEAAVLKEHLTRFIDVIDNAVFFGFVC